MNGDEESACDKFAAINLPAQRGPTLGARFCVPNPNRKVLVPPPYIGRLVFPRPPTTTNLCAARREKYREDGVDVPARRVALAGLDVPDLDSVVPTSTGQGCAVRAPDHRHDPTFR
jgi:hypothetical protein